MKITVHHKINAKSHINKEICDMCFGKNHLIKHCSRIFSQMLIIDRLYILFTIGIIMPKHK